MSGFNGSGTFNISGVGLPYTSGTTISSSVANTLNTDLAAGLSNCITKDGQQILTANIPFGGYKITGLGTGSASADSASVYNIQCNTGAFIAVTGTDTIVGTATPALTAGYVTGMRFQFFAAGANTGAVTLNINSQGAKAVTKNGTTALVAGDIPNGVLVTVTYDGTQFVLNNQTSFGSVTITGDISVSGNSTVTGNSTISGNLTVSGNVTAPNLFAMKNRIINGNMNIAQRGTSFAGVTATGIGYYFTDRFLYVGVNGGPAVVTLSQDTSVPSNNQFQYNSKVVVTTADTSIASGDYYHFAQVIEGYNVRDLIGQPFTLSFWVKSNVTGTYCVSFRNQGSPVGTADRSYIAEYTINAADTWEYKTISVTGGLITAGTWNWTNGFGLTVNWALAAGSTYQTTAGAWQTGTYLTTSNQVNAVGTVGNTFAITGVQLEKGAVASAFEYRPIGLETALCQRYYEIRSNLDDGAFWSGNTTAGNVYYQVQTFQTPKRTSPTIALIGNEGVQGFPAVPTISAYGASPYGFRTSSVASGTNSASYYRCYWTASAEL